MLEIAIFFYLLTLAVRKFEVAYSFILGML